MATYEGIILDALEVADPVLVSSKKLEIRHVFNNDTVGQKESRKINGHNEWTRTIELSKPVINYAGEIIGDIEYGEKEIQKYNLIINTMFESVNVDALPIKEVRNWRGIFIDGEGENDTPRSYPLEIAWTKRR